MNPSDIPSHPEKPRQTPPASNGLPAARYNVSSGPDSRSARSGFPMPTARGAGRLGIEASNVQPPEPWQPEEDPAASEADTEADQPPQPAPAGGGGGGDIPNGPDAPPLANPEPGDPEPERGAKDLWQEFEDTKGPFPFLMDVYDATDGSYYPDLPDYDGPELFVPDERMYLPEVHEGLGGRNAPDVSSSMHRPGDVMVFKSTHSPDDPDIKFTVTRKDWTGLGLNSVPQAELIGQLSGTALPDDVAGPGEDNRVRLLGSGFGVASSITMNVVSGGKSPHFESVHGTELVFDGYGYLNTERIEESHTEIRTLDPAQLTDEAFSSVLGHLPRMEAVSEITTALGIGFHSMTPHQAAPVYQDSRVEVFEQRTTQASSFTSLDKWTGRWVNVSYHDHEGEAILKVSIADLDPQQVETIHTAGIGRDDVVSSMETGVVTYASSDRLGIDAITYKPTPQDTAEYLGLQAEGEDVYIPEIQIINDQVRITNGFLSSQFQDNPALQNRVTERIRYNVYANGDRVLSLGDKKIVLPDPVKVLHRANPFRPRN